MKEGELEGAEHGLRVITSHTLHTRADEGARGALKRANITLMEPLRVAAQTLNRKVETGK